MMPIRHGYADTPQGQVPYLEMGQGEPIVLMHLAPRSKEMFEPLMPLLAPRYRTIAIDMLGFGDAPPIPMIGDTADLVSVGRSVVEVLDALGIRRAHLFGVHTGAHFAAQAAAHWPERFQSLTLLGLGMREPGEDQSALAALAKYSSFPEPQLDGTHLMSLWSRWYQDVVRYWLHARMPLEDPTAPRFASRPMPFRPLTTFLTDEEVAFIERGVIDALRSYRNNGMQGYKAMISVDMPQLLSRIRAPTRHLDPDSPYESPFCQRGARVAALVRDGTFETLAGVDEHACEMAPQIVAAALLRFIAHHPIANT